jgi:hypothetical protein
MHTKPDVADRLLADNQQHAAAFSGGHLGSALSASSPS